MSQIIIFKRRFKNILKFIKIKAIILYYMYFSFVNKYNHFEIKHKKMIDLYT